MWLLDELHMHMQHSSVFKQISTLHVLCSDVSCIPEIILQRPIASLLYWTWLVRVLSGLFPARLSVCPGSECCLCCPLHLVTTLFWAELVLNNRTVCKIKILSMNMVNHVGGSRCCESNESRYIICWLIRELSLWPGPFPNFWAGPGDEASKGPVGAVGV